MHQVSKMRGISMGNETNTCARPTPQKSTSKRHPSIAAGVRKETPADGERDGRTDGRTLEKNGVEQKPPQKTARIHRRKCQKPGLGTTSVAPTLCYKVKKNTQPAKIATPISAPGRDPKNCFPNNAHPWRFWPENGPSARPEHGQTVPWSRPDRPWWRPI